MIPGIAFECGCPDCGADLVPLAGGKPTDLLVSIMLQCTGCRADVQVSVVMAVTHRPKYRAPNGCGQVRRKTRAKVNA